MGQYNSDGQITDGLIRDVIAEVRTETGGFNYGRIVNRVCSRSGADLRTAHQCIRDYCRRNGSALLSSRIAGMAYIVLMAGALGSLIDGVWTGRWTLADVGGSSEVILIVVAVWFSRKRFMWRP
jgi:hypothetical protein